jgi:hypothetical protein
LRRRWVGEWLSILCHFCFYQIGKKTGELKPSMSETTPERKRPPVERLPADMGSSVAVPLPREGEAGPGTSAAALARFPPSAIGSVADERESVARIRAKADTLGRPSVARPASPERGRARP